MDLPQVHIIERPHGITGKCRHFRGMHEHDTCEAGVKYSDVAVDGDWKYSYSSRGIKNPYTMSRCWPCHSRSNLGGATCEKASYYTADEIAEWERQTKELFNRTVVARAAIVTATGGERGVAGQIACPVCKTGELRYSVASINGHIHARCSTAECVAWME